MADGAGVSYQDVLDIHTFVDIRAGEYGCSVVASREELAGYFVRVVATNHFRSLARQSTNESSKLREKILLLSPLDQSVASHKRALQRTCWGDTIQSIVFDVSKRKIHLAHGWSEAAKTSWNKYHFFKVFSRVCEICISKNYIMCLFIKLI